MDVGDFKQVIVVRTDLRMGKGKLAAQVAHAAVSAAEVARREKPEWFRRWIETGQKKIVVKVRGLEELFSLRRAAEELGIPTFLVVDAGFTQLKPGTITCLGLGPAPSELLDKVTGGLPLL